MASPILRTSLSLVGKGGIELPKKFLYGVEWAAQNQIPIHVGGDLKAHSEIWGRATDLVRGFQVEKLLYDYILMGTNKGEVPKFVTIIDLTIVSPDVKNIPHIGKISLTLGHGH